MKIKRVTTQTEIANREGSDRKKVHNGAKAIWLTLKLKPGECPNVVSVAGRTIAEVEQKLKTV